jgi:hypothetical protein
VRFETVPPTLLATMGWSPELFAGPAAVAIRASVFGTTLAEMRAQVIDGWRVSETPGVMTYDPRAATTPIYRQANIGQFRLILDDQHWVPPQITGQWCVQPDDVVLNKMAPVRAALVTQNAKRHPVDGNTIIVRGLKKSMAAWVAVCLNHTPYEQLLVVESGVLKRVGLSALASLKLPPAPLDMDPLVAPLSDIIDETTLARERLHDVQTEALEEADLPTHPVIGLRGGHFFPGRAMTGDNWLPSWVALRTEHAALDEENGWVALGDLASFDERTRLGSVDDSAHSLRLSDVGEDLFVPSVEHESSSETTATRMLAKPLVPGEVLVSTLGSSFRAAYVDEEAPAHTHPVDGWVRLRFRETPAAWALLLSTAPVRAQAARLTIGSVQQFVPPDALRLLRLPMPPREVRDRWQRAVERHHAQRRSLDRRWSELMNELSSLFDAVHRPFRSQRLSVLEVTR